jgi:hypothetical protein
MSPPVEEARVIRDLIEAVYDEMRLRLAGRTFDEVHAVWLAISDDKKPELIGSDDPQRHRTLLTRHAALDLLVGLSAEANDRRT